jgi:hypothetical protein
MSNIDKLGEIPLRLKIKAHDRSSYHNFPLIHIYIYLNYFYISNTTRDIYA